jgi:hypothetical protein
MKSALKFGQERMVALMLCLLLGQAAPIQFRTWSAPEGQSGMGSGAASVPAKDYSGQILERAKQGVERAKTRNAEHGQFLAATAAVAAVAAEWQTLIVDQPVRTPQSCDFHTPPGRAPPVSSLS